MLSTRATTAAVLVVYGPVSRLAEALQRLSTLVGRVLLVDNNEQPAPGLPDQVAGLTVQLLHHGNRGGLAGAYNRALALLSADATVAQVIFLDQDSDTSGLSHFLDAADVRATLGRADVAAVAPAYRDRATGLRGRPIELGRWRWNHLPRQFEGLHCVAFVINSMAVWRLDALRRIGPFNEILAIDHVDTEYCLRARQVGLALWVHGSHEFVHAIGERRRYRLFGRELQAGGHGPTRRRLIGRNTALLARVWCWREPAFAGLCLLRLVYETTGILMVEDHKLAKLGALWRGVLQSLFIRSGP